MSQPVEFSIVLENHLWSVRRDGAELHKYSHAERAVHEAVELARELEHTGQPAQVRLHAADGKLIEISTTEDPPADEDEEAAAEQARPA